MANFALIGAAGYIAPRHFKAISDTGNQLLAAADPHDSVGILDRYSRTARFFTEIERFDRYLSRIQHEGEESRLHYLAICSPNYLHDAHARMGLRAGANVICEKPLVINPWNLDQLQMIERETGGKVYSVLQLRLHPQLIEFRNKLLAQPTGKKHEVTLSYITPRGMWYLRSWKGVEEKSGGLATNIGIHLFDLLHWLFGAEVRSELHLNDPQKIAGMVEFQNAYVRWFLSVDAADLPDDEYRKANKAFRSLTMDGTEIEFSEGFTDLHTRVYEDILRGGGFGIDDARPSIELVHHIRKQPVTHGDFRHPLLP